MEKQYLTVAEAAEKASVSEYTIREWCNKGKIPGLAKTPGGGSRIPLDFIRPVVAAETGE